MIWLNRHVVEVQGSKMYVDLFHKDLSMRRTFRAYAVNRIHEETTTSLFCRVVKEGDVVVDLGANIGYFTLLAARLVGKNGRVYAFEPEPRNFEYLQRNINLNKYDHVEALHKAVADKPGIVKLFFCTYDTGHHTIQKYDGIQAYRPDLAGEEGRFVEVEQITLDDFFKTVQRPVNVIKMDVEGAEMLALTGMQRLIIENPSLVMFVEFFPLLISKMGQSPEEFAQRIFQDFNVFVVEGDYSMTDNESGKTTMRLWSVEELLKLCSGPNDHINLYIEKKNAVTRL